DRLAQLGTMAAGIAHEIRNPLSAMLGAVELQSLPITPEQKTSSLRILKEEVLRLDEILTGLLEYSSPRAKSARCRWLEVFDRVAKLMRPDLPDTLQLSRTGPEVELAVPGTHFQQILINLLRNAARAAASGPPEGARPAVAVTLSVIGDSALVVVADNGPGIPRDLLPQLFIPFSSRSAGGTGLGLATVRRLAELYGGRAWAENAPRGARFLVELPLA
ncbi:MAG: sensor histidine kinase, partial [Elusimicrobia bacterium]